MRSRYKFSEVNGYLYFVTLTIIEKIPILTNSTYIQVLIDNMKFYRAKKNLKIFYYVIMDNHMHLIVSQDGDISKALQCFKSYTAKEILKLLTKDNRKWILQLMKYYKKPYKRESKYQFWQEGNHPQQIFSWKMLRQKVNYIHFNPVKRGLVSKPDDWFYSSARNFTGKEVNFAIDELEL